MVVLFDMKALKVVGEPVVLLDNVGTVRWSDDGTAVYRPDRWRWRGVYGTREGSIRLVPGIDRGHWYGPVASPDGRRIAWMLSQGTEDNVWLTDGTAGTVRPLTFSDSSAPREPVAWSRDGARVFFREDRLFDAPASGRPPLTLMAVNAENPSALDTAFTHETLSRDLSVAPDGRTVLWVPYASEGQPGPAIWRGTIGSTDATEVLRVPRGAVGSPKVSPDGRWIAYVSTESGVAEVYVQAFPQGGDKLQVTTDGTDATPRGRSVLWSRSGRSLLVGRYASPPELLEIRLDLAARRVVERSTVLRQSFRVRWSDVLPGDSTFLGATPDLMPGESPRFVIVQGMLAEIRRRLEGSR